MKILYEATNKKPPIYIEGAYTPQRILLLFYDSDTLYIYYADDYLRSVFLNIVEKTNILSEVLHADHLKRIENDAEFDYYIQWIEARYNFNGIHINENIDAHAYGGAVLVDENGIPLYDGKKGNL